MTSEPPPAKNELLAALPRGAYLRLLPHLESVSLPLLRGGQRRGRRGVRRA